MNWYVCWEEATEIISTIEVANEMESAIKVATQVKNCNGGSKWNGIYNGVYK